MFDGTTSQEISLPRRNLSKVYSLPPGALTLWFLPEPMIAPVPMNLAAPKVVIPEGLTDFYLLVSSDPKNPVIPLKVQVVDASSSQFRTGQMMWFNLTDHEVGGRVGSKRLAIKGRSKVVIDSPADQQADYGVELLFKISTEEQPRPMTSTVWAYNPEAKWIVFIFNEEGRRAPRVAGFADFRD